MAKIQQKNEDKYRLTRYDTSKTRVINVYFIGKNRNSLDLKLPNWMKLCVLNKNRIESVVGQSYYLMFFFMILNNLFWMRVGKFWTFFLSFSYFNIWFPIRIKANSMHKKIPFIDHCYPFTRAHSQSILSLLFCRLSFRNERIQTNNLRVCKSLLVRT